MTSVAGSRRHTPLTRDTHGWVGAWAFTGRDPVTNGYTWMDPLVNMYTVTGGCARVDDVVSPGWSGGGRPCPRVNMFSYTRVTFRRNSERACSCVWLHVSDARSKHGAWCASLSYVCVRDGTCQPRKDKCRAPTLLLATATMRRCDNDNDCSDNSDNYTALVYSQHKKTFMIRHIKQTFCSEASAWKSLIQWKTRKNKQKHRFD